MVLLLSGLLRQRLGENGPDRIFAIAMARSSRHIEHRPNALANPPRRLWLCEPDRLKHFVSLGDAYEINARRANDGEGVRFQCLHPLL